MHNHRDLVVCLPTLAIRPGTSDQISTLGFGRAGLWRNEQPEGSAFSGIQFKRLKNVSGRLKRLLLGQDKLAPNKPAVRHLLVVDDEQSILFSMSEYFSRQGFTVDTAREQGEAEKLIENTNYQVVIQDLRLGITRQNEGMQIIKLIHERNPETRIVVLTSYGSSEIEAEARRSGADAFLHKPKPLSQVAQVIQGLMESPGQRGAPHA
jgi:ActR/RegA family two-component response regulator